MTATCFYIEIPGDSEWNTILPKCVVEAEPLSSVKKEQPPPAFVVEKLQVLHFQEWE